MIQLTIMGQKGDEVMVAEPVDAEALAPIQAKFDELMASGYSAFLVDQSGEAGRVDKLPDEGEVVMFGQIVGG